MNFYFRPHWEMPSMEPFMVNDLSIKDLDSRCKSELHCNRQNKAKKSAWVASAPRIFSTEVRSLIWWYGNHPCLVDGTESSAFSPLLAVVSCSYPMWTKAPPPPHTLCFHVTLRILSPSKWQAEMWGIHFFFKKTKPPGIYRSTSGHPNLPRCTNFQTGISTNQLTN